MIAKNIYNNLEPPLERHIDERGDITDIFYGQKITHMAIVNSKANVVRGNHYHKKTWQWILITKGSMSYFYKDSADENDKVKSIEAFEGNLIYTPPMEVHAMLSGKHGCQFITYGYGKRAGKDYEKDTFRVESIIPKNI